MKTLEKPEKQSSEAIPSPQENLVQKSTHEEIIEIIENPDIIPPRKFIVREIPGKGRGIIASENINQGEIIETFPLIVLNKNDAEFISSKNSDTLRFYYIHQLKFDRACIMLGYGSIYNHSNTPNADFEYSENEENQSITVRAISDIKAGEEICWNYNFQDGIEDYL
ncbi:MAG: SET domain-containing protein-lysine N-methyltransferase [Candidatus Gracilibacteria bacterium]|jgi:SET domain-containing protein|nr:SET domain-containing protein-lysine N-methyltransferase [Candidatus Gracilibacteria bacterium]